MKLFQCYFPGVARCPGFLAKSRWKNVNGKPQYRLKKCSGTRGKLLWFKAFQATRGKVRSESFEVVS